MKHYFFLAVAAVIMMLSTSCASQRAITGNVDAIQAKLDARIKAFNLDENAGGTIKMKRDQAIQISLTKYGIEGVRVTFTPDSILFVNKLSRTYLRTSFRDADKAMGGEGTLNFRNVQAFFWNDNNENRTYSTLPVAGVVPLELKTNYGRSLRVGQYRIPCKINLDMEGANGAIETGEATMKLSKVRAANNWEPNTEISSKYKSLNVVSLIKGLLKK